jgi:hypothetical protein
MSLSAIFSKTNMNDFIVFPNAVFYLKQNSVINKLRQLFKNPKEIKIQNIERENNFLGFNEIDYVVKVKSNDIIIDATNMMNYVRLGNSNNYLDEKIKFDKNKIHFFEFKTQGNNADEDIIDLTTKSKRFMKIFKVNSSNFDFLGIGIDDYKCHFVYDDNRESISEKISLVNEQDSSIIYSSPGNEITLLVNIQSKMGNEINNLKNEISELNSKFKIFEQNVGNLFKDSINPKSIYTSQYENLSSKLINFKSLLSENDKFEKEYLTFKSISQEKQDSWIALFDICFKGYLHQTEELDNKISSFFLSMNNFNELLIIRECLGKSQFHNNEEKKLKDLFANLNPKIYQDMLYLSMKYVFFQINNEKLVDCYSDKEDLKIHDMIIKIFEYVKYLKDCAVKENELIIAQVGILKQIIEIAKINKSYSKLCVDLLCVNKISLRQFIIGCILSINAENDNDMDLFKNFLSYYEY